MPNFVTAFKTWHVVVLVLFIQVKFVLFAWHEVTCVKLSTTSCHFIFGAIHGYQPSFFNKYGYWCSFLSASELYELILTENVVKV